MDARAQPRAAPAERDPRDRRARVARRRDRVAGLLEDGHVAVAEPLDDDAVALRDGRLDRERDPAQQLQRALVAGLQRPRGEADEVGEEDRQLALAVAAALRLRERLPQLQRAEAGLARDARALQAQRREPLAEQLGRLVAGDRERVAVALVARQPRPRAAGRVQRALVRVESSQCRRGACAPRHPSTGMTFDAGRAAMPRGAARRSSTTAVSANATPVRWSSRAAKSATIASTACA